MDLILQKHKRVWLRDIGLDEYWLQDRINEDPSILGLQGEPAVYRKETKQGSGGRLDFLLLDRDTEVMYEVEVMLGRTDESHIIRTIEYWDLERHRYPEREHRAVVVAEEITSRFFNVISLLNRSVPMIALQLAALEADGKLLLHFTKILDLAETPAAEVEEGAETTDRTWFEKHSSAEGMAVFDRCVETLSQGGHQPKLSYRKDSIAILGAKVNFCWFIPRKKPYCIIAIRIGPEHQEPLKNELDPAGIVLRYTEKGLNLRITPHDLTQHEQLVIETIKLAAEKTGGGFA